MIKKAVVVGLVLALWGCSSSIKPPPKTPVPLVAIDDVQVVLNPIFATKLSVSGLGQSRALHAKDTPALQVAADEKQYIVANALGKVEAYDAGQTLWSVNLGEPIVSGVSYDKAGQIVLVGTRLGNMIALDSQTGSIRWKQSLESTSLAPALVAGNRVLISANNGIIYGLNLQNGTIIWRFNTQNPMMSVRGTATPLRLDGATALFGTADGRIHALSIDQGRPLWTRRIGVGLGGASLSLTDVDGTPLVVDNQLYATSVSGHFMGFDMTTGRTLFTVRDFATIHPVVYQQGILMGVSTDGIVYGFNTQTGEKLWQNNALQYRKPTAPVVFGRFVAIGDFEGVIHLFSKEGDVVGRTAIAGKNRIVSLDVQNEKLIAQTHKGDVVAWQ